MRPREQGRDHDAGSLAAACRRKNDACDCPQSRENHIRPKCSQVARKIPALLWRGPTRRSRIARRRRRLSIHVWVYSEQPCTSLWSPTGPTRERLLPYLEPSLPSHSQRYNCEKRRAAPSDKGPRESSEPTGASSARLPATPRPHHPLPRRVTGAAHGSENRAGPSRGESPSRPAACCVVIKFT